MCYDHSSSIRALCIFATFDNYNLLVDPFYDKTKFIFYSDFNDSTCRHIRTITQEIIEERDPGRDAMAMDGILIFKLAIQKKKLRGGSSSSSISIRFLRTFPRVETKLLPAVEGRLWM